MKKRRRNNYSVKYDILFYGNGIFQYIFSELKAKHLLAYKLLKGVNKIFSKQYVQNCYLKEKHFLYSEKAKCH